MEFRNKWKYTQLMLIIFIHYFETKSYYVIIIAAHEMYPNVHSCQM